MKKAMSAVLRDLAHPLEPISTGVPPRHRELTGIRAVLFDLYGTLLVSASGDRSASSPRAFSEAWTELSESHLPAGAAVRATQLLSQAIEEDHERARVRGIEHGEVDIRAVFREVLSKLSEESLLPAGVSVPDEGALALQYEARVNPAWPMPGARECLRVIHAAGLILGIISNAQFFSLDLLRALMDASISELGLDPGLLYCSFEIGEAKPSPAMHLQAANDLVERGIRPDEVLYVGNDMLNDMTPASRVGFRTALFAGDARSLRMREGDPRVAGVAADLVLSSLAELPRCLGL